jgi:hypothetical protein
VKSARVWAATGCAGLAGVLLAWPAGDVRAPVAPLQRTPQERPAWAALPPAQPAPAEALEAPEGALALAAPAAPLPQHAMVPVTLVVPARLYVGEQTELHVGLGAHTAVGEIGFTIQFDPNVLQVRAGAPGTWASGDGTRFAVEIPEGADRVQIRSAAAGPRAGGAGGTVALVQFQAVASGTTAVTVTDVTARDGSGRSIPVLLSMPTVHLTAEALPPATADAGAAAKGAESAAAATDGD